MDSRQSVLRCGEGSIAICEIPAGLSVGQEENQDCQEPQGHLPAAYLVWAGLQTTRELSEALLVLAQHIQDPTYLPVAHYDLVRLLPGRAVFEVPLPISEPPGVVAALVSGSFLGKGVGLRCFLGGTREILPQLLGKSVDRILTGFCSKHVEYGPHHEQKTIPTQVA